MQYRREIDGLRALAVVPVILFHAGFQLFSGGFVGVDVFFVISGYLITSIILADIEAGKFTLIDFYERRARRILPALFLVMAVCLPFSWIWLLPDDMKDFSQSLIAVSLFSSNILFWLESGYFDAAAELKPLLHTWSLAVEEQFYVLFPLILLSLQRFRIFWRTGILLVAFIVSLVLAQWLSLYAPIANFLLLPTRVWELLLGAFVAIYCSRRGIADFNKYASEFLSITGLALVLFAVFAFDKNTPFPGLYSLIPTLGTVLIILFTSPVTLAGKLLGSKVLVGLGLISYSAYLWHQPLFAFFRHLSMNALSTAALLSLSIASIVMAIFSWHYIEKPFRDKKLISRKAILSFSVFGTLTFIILGLSGIQTNGFEFRMDGNYYRSIQKVIEAKHGQKTCWDKLAKYPRVENACRFGKPKAQHKFALVGDSHAGSMASAFSKISAQNQVEGLNLTLIRCPSLQASMEKNQDAVAVTCGRFKSDFFEKLTDGVIPEILVLSSRWTIMLENKTFDNKQGGIESGPDSVWESAQTDAQGYKRALSRDYADSIKKMLSSGRTVVLVYPIPEMGWNVPNRLLRIYNSKGEVGISDGSTSHELFKDRNKSAYAALDAIGRHPNLHRIYPEKIFCNTYLKGRCVAHINGMPLYYDDDHLSEYGAGFIVKQVFGILGWTDVSSQQAKSEFSIYNNH